MMKTHLRLIVPGVLLIGTSYGMARFAYGLFLPRMRDDVGLSASMSGFIGSGSYVGYCLAIVTSALLVERFGPRCVAVGAALIAAIGMAVVSVSTTAWLLAAAILFAGISTGLASPPMAQAVATSLPADRQRSANAIINSGTSIGVAVSGPVAFLATGQWRIAYAAFAITALLNALLLMLGMSPGGRIRPAQHEPGKPAISSIFRPRALVLMLAATGMGIASAAFWTFASDVVVTQGGFSQSVANILWILIGVSGLAGALAGDWTTRFGINSAHRGSLATLALALCLLVIRPDAYPTIFLSAALFGASYIMLTGIYLVWGVDIYADRPALGLSLPFLMIAVGQVVGSPLAGYLIESLGYMPCFIVFALVALATMLASYPRSSTCPPRAVFE